MGHCNPASVKEPDSVSKKQKRKRKKETCTRAFIIALFTVGETGSNVLMSTNRNAGKQMGVYKLKRITISISTT